MDLAPSPSVRAGGDRDGVDRVEHDGVTPSSLPGCRRSSVRTVRTSPCSADTEIIGTDTDKLETLFSTGVVWLVDRGNVTGIEPVMNSARLAGGGDIRPATRNSAAGPTTEFGSRRLLDGADLRSGVPVLLEHDSGELSDSACFPRIKLYNSSRSIAAGDVHP